MSFKILISLILLSSLSTCNKTPLPKSTPNVILILVDDMGYSDLGAYGSEVATPNIDRMAFNGVRFTNAYNTSKCFPSRASLLTGLYSQQIGYHKSFRQPMLNAITLGEMFQLVGYTTLWSGKHHSIENPVDRGFDHYSGLLDGASNHFNPGLKERVRDNRHKRGSEILLLATAIGSSKEKFTILTLPNPKTFTLLIFLQIMLLIGWIKSNPKNPFSLSVLYGSA